MFLDQNVIDHIVAETNRYSTENSMLKCRLHIWSWQPVTSDGVYMVFGLIMTMGTEEKLP
jgi:hypothetical protein